MIRKMIRLSPSTNVVSLPSPWVKKNKIGKGDDLSVDEVDNRIIVSTKGKKSASIAEIDIRQLSGKLLWVQIDAAYTSGYDTIKILFNGAKQKDELNTAVRRFPGMIISDERTNELTFKDIADNPHEDLSSILSRIFNMNISMLEDGLEALKKSEWNELSSFKKRDYVINSYVSYCFRQLNKFGYEPMSKTGIMHTYIKILEILADKISALFVGIGNGKIKAEEKIFSQLIEIFKLIQRLHFGFTIPGLLAIDSKRQDFAAMKVKNQMVLTCIIEMSDLLFDLEEVEMHMHA